MEGGLSKIAGLEVVECDIYLLEGMHGMELVEKIVDKKGSLKSLLCK